MYLDIARVMFVVFDRDVRVTLINKKGCKDRRDVSLPHQEKVEFEHGLGAAAMRLPVVERPGRRREAVRRDRH